MLIDRRNFPSSSRSSIMWHGRSPRRTSPHASLRAATAEECAGDPRRRRGFDVTAENWCCSEMGRGSVRHADPRHRFPPHTYFGTTNGPLCGARPQDDRGRTEIRAASYRLRAAEREADPKVRPDAPHLRDLGGGPTGRNGGSISELSRRHGFDFRKIDPRSAASCSSKARTADRLVPREPFGRPRPGSEKWDGKCASIATSPRSAGSRRGEADSGRPPPARLEPRRLLGRWGGDGSGLGKLIADAAAAPSTAPDAPRQSRLHRRQPTDVFVIGDSPTEMRRRKHLPGLAPVACSRANTSPN